MSTIRDVAADAGVSISTVSRTLNNPSYGPLETRKRVLDAARKQGYRPSSIARSMVKGKTGLIALVIPDVRNPFFTDVARGVEDVANKYSHGVILCNTDEDPVKEHNYLEVLRGKIVDGFIIAVASENNRELTKVDRKKCPFVLIDRTCHGVEVDTVIINNRKGAYLAVDHLLKLGHKRIGIVTGKRDTLTGRDRFRGYVDAYERHGIPLDDNLIKDGKFSIEGGYEAMQALLNLTEKLTAVFISNNAMSIGCLKAISEHGVRIPDDLAVARFDDSLWAPFFTPPLTVVRQSPYTMGSLASELLFQRIGGSGPPERKEIVLNSELVIRQSSGGMLPPEA